MTSAPQLSLFVPAQRVNVGPVTVCSALPPRTEPSSLAPAPSEDTGTHGPVARRRGPSASPQRHRGAELSREQRFEEFHRANPHVYVELVRFARQAKAAGRDRIGIRLVWERLRWDLMIKTQRPGDEPKLNDHMSARYARLIMRQEHDLAGIFETRDRHK